MVNSFSGISGVGWTRIIRSGTTAASPDLNALPMTKMADTKLDRARRARQNLEVRPYGILHEKMT